MQIAYEIAALFGGAAALQARVDAFKAALVAHAHTVGVAAPTEDPFVEQIARSGDTIEVLPAPAPPPPPPPPAPPHLVDPGSIVKRLQPYAAALKAAIEGDAGMWMLWQRMSCRTQPIDMNDPEFPQAWAALGSIIGPMGGDPDAILAAIQNEDAF